MLLLYMSHDIINPPSAKYWYMGIPLNQYNDYIFRFFMKKALIQVPTCLVQNKYIVVLQKEKWSRSAAFLSVLGCIAPKVHRGKLLNLVYNLAIARVKLCSYIDCLHSSEHEKNSIKYGPFFLYIHCLFFISAHGKWFFYSRDVFLH